MTESMASFSPQSSSGLMSFKPECGFEEALKVRFSVLEKGIILDYQRSTSALQAEIGSLKEQLSELGLQIPGRLQTQLTTPADTNKGLVKTDEDDPEQLNTVRQPVMALPIAQRSTHSAIPMATELQSTEQEDSMLSITCAASKSNNQPEESLDSVPLQCDPSSPKKESGSPRKCRDRASVKSNVSFKDDLEDAQEPPDAPEATSTVAQPGPEAPAATASESNRGSLRSGFSENSFLDVPNTSQKPKATQRGRSGSKLDPTRRASAGNPPQRGSMVSNSSPRTSTRTSRSLWNFGHKPRNSGRDFKRGSYNRTSTMTSQEDGEKSNPMTRYFTLKLSHVRSSRGSVGSVETLEGCMHRGRVAPMSAQVTDGGEHTEPLHEEEDGVEEEGLKSETCGDVEVNAQELQNVCFNLDHQEDITDEHWEDYQFVVLPQWVKKQKRRSTHMSNSDSIGTGMNFVQWDEDEIQHGVEDEVPLEGWERKCKPFILKPTSPIRMLWDLVGFIFIVWDTIMLPLEFFKPAETQFMYITTWLVRIYWSLDFPTSFFTGYDRPEGSVETRPSYVARKYMRTWFGFDVCIITFDWLEIAVDGMKGLAALRMGKIGKAVRLLRMVRLLRVLKLNRGVAVPEIVKVIFYKMSSERVSIFLGMLRMILFLAGVVHFIGCCWYGIGKDGPSPSWVEYYAIDDKEFRYVYMSTFHWALTQFAGSMDIQPHNFGERLFAVSALLFGFIFAAFVVSSITSSMTRLQIVMARQSTQVSMLNHYLWDNGISAKLALRVQRNAMNAAAQDARNTPEEEVELLQLVSEPLQIEMHYEIYCPTLHRHPFFSLYKDKNCPAMRRICHAAATRLGFFAGDVIFHVGEEPQEPRMYFCQSGIMEYMHMHGDTAIISDGQWLCESCLWTSWTHCGSLRATAALSLVALDAQLFIDIASQFQTGEFYPFKYAQLFTVALNKITKHSLTDLHDPRMSLHALAKKAFDPAAAHLFRRKSRMTRTDQVRTEEALQQEVEQVLESTPQEVENDDPDKETVIKKIHKTLSNLSNIANAATNAVITRTNTTLSFRDSMRSTTRSTRGAISTRSTNRWTNVVEGEEGAGADDGNGAELRHGNSRLDVPGSPSGASYGASPKASSPSTSFALYGSQSAELPGANTGSPGSAYEGESAFRGTGTAASATASATSASMTPSDAGNLEKS